jgi:hypothetical protein
VKTILIKSLLRKVGLDRNEIRYVVFTCFFIKSLVRFTFGKAQSLYHLTIAIATVIAGFWIYHLFISERASNAHLFMDIKPTISTNEPSLGDRRLVFLDVFLNNTGRRKIVAEQVSSNTVAYSDPGETIQYSCGIQVRSISTPLIQTNQDIDWFNNTNLLMCPSGLPQEIDLLGECELADGTPDFWIEPTDQCHIGHTLVLMKGDYLIKLHFIGTDPAEQFWSRVFYIRVD